jgi:Leucine-rich repeat (LRR) protein
MKPLSRELAIAGSLDPQTTEQKAGQSESDLKIIELIEKSGGSVRKIAQNDDRLEVDFHLQPSTLTDEQLAPLSKLKNIFELHLGNTNITDRGMAYLEGLTTLVRLHLERTKITDTGLKYLKNLKNLAYLNLYGTGVTDAGLAPLKGLSNLKNLYLWQTKVTPAGVNDLKKALPSLNVDTGAELELSKTTTQEPKEKGEVKK